MQSDMQGAACADESRMRDLAQSVDCLTEHDFRLLTATTAGTVEAWRKRGLGPEYILAGNSYLYPRAGVQRWLLSQVRERKSNAKGVL